MATDFDAWGGSFETSWWLSWTKSEDLLEEDRVVPTADFRRKKEFFEEELLLMFMSLK